MKGEYHFNDSVTKNRSKTWGDTNCMVCDIIFTKATNTQIYCSRKCFKKFHYKKTKQASQVLKNLKPSISCVHCNHVYTLDFDPSLNKNAELFTNLKCPSCEQFRYDEATRVKAANDFALALIEVKQDRPEVKNKKMKEYNKVYVERKVHITKPTSGIHKAVKPKKFISREDYLQRQKLYNLKRPRKQLIVLSPQEKHKRMVEASRKYRINHPEQARANSLKYRETHKEFVQHIGKQYRIKHRDEINKKRMERFHATYVPHPRIKLTEEQLKQHHRDQAARYRAMKKGLLDTK